MTRRKKQAGRALSWALTAVLALALGCNLYLLGARLAGVRRPAVLGFFPAVVVSGSMEPALRAGDLILVRARSGYAAGDVILFESGGALVTHRIVGETEDGFVTRGDANNVSDADPVPRASVVGAVVLRIPAAGAVLLFFRTGPGMALLVLALALLLEWPLLVRWMSGAEEGGHEP